MLLRFLRRHPLARGMSAYCLLYPGANVVQQSQVRKRDAVDWAEARRFLLYGGLCHAPLVHRWLSTANRWFPGSSIRAIAKKVILDQLLFAPVALSSFYVGLSILEGKDAEGVYREWREKFPHNLDGEE